MAQKASMNSLEFTEDFCIILFYQQAPYKLNRLVEVEMRDTTAAK